VGRGRPPGAAGEDRDAKGEEQILEHLDVPGDRAPLRLTLPRHVGDAQEAAVREADRLEEPGEAPHVAHPALGLDLLIEVEGGVRREHVRRARCSDDQRHQADRERLLEPKLRQLGRHERVQGAQERPAGQQIDASAPQRADARASQHEPAPRG
jgi:hypothetical protein